MIYRSVYSVEFSVICRSVYSVEFRYVGLFTV